MERKSTIEDWARHQGALWKATAGQAGKHYDTDLVAHVFPFRNYRSGERMADSLLPLLRDSRERREMIEGLADVRKQRTSDQGGKRVAEVVSTFFRQNKLDTGHLSPYSSRPCP
ncbi:MAG: hypothetical protein WD708_06440 [Kiritimatiellia bacterium]